MFCVIILSPVVLELSAAIQLYVEATLLVKGMDTAPSLHIFAVLALVIEGIGLTVISTILVGDDSQAIEFNVDIVVRLY